jgi:hypothetical protein
MRMAIPSDRNVVKRSQKKCSNTETSGKKCKVCGMQRE